MDGVRGGFVIVPLLELFNLALAAIWALVTAPWRLMTKWRTRRSIE
jgi:hypothetical protein